LRRKIGKSSGDGRWRVRVEMRCRVFSHTRGINEVTVKAHRGQVVRKMAADSLPDLVTMAIRLGLLPAAKH